MVLPLILYTFFTKKFRNHFLIIYNRPLKLEWRFQRNFTAAHSCLIKGGALLQSSQFKRMNSLFITQKLQMDIYQQNTGLRSWVQIIWVWFRFQKIMMHFPVLSGATATKIYSISASHIEEPILILTKQKFTKKHEKIVTNF